MASSLLNKKPNTIHSSSRMIDPHAVREHLTVKHSVLEQIELSESVGTVAYGANKVHFKVPRSGKIHTLMLKLDYSQGSSDVMPNDSFYLSLISEYEVRIGSQTVFRCSDYRALMPWVLSKIKEAKRKLFLNNAGTATADYPDLYIPLWTPFCQLCNGVDGLAPLPSYAVDGDIEVIVSFYPAADSTVSGTAGTLGGGKLVVFRSLSDDESPNETWTCKSYTIQEGGPRAGISTTASRSSESHINGDLAELYLAYQTDSAQTAKDWITTSLPEAVDIINDGVTIEQFDSVHALKMRQCVALDYEKMATAPSADIAVIPFSYHNGANIAGQGFRINRNSLELLVTGAANSWMKVYGVVHATYGIENGKFKMVI